MKIMTDTFRSDQLFQVTIWDTDGLVLVLLGIDAHPKLVQVAKSKIEWPKSSDSKLV